MSMAPYAVSEANSCGRRIFEARPEGRGEFQRDRDRIVHSTAFRRLEYKTQVFVNHEGDLFRTRLTHSIEVAQIARSIARVLAVNEDLSEAIAFAHDLGHTPFGHAGQDALNECMKAYGGFEHNLQSLRTVEVLEEHYAEFSGLNLMYETREGILKHCSLPNARLLGDLGKRFIDKRQPSLEAQLNNYADEIAYNNHDLDDGLRSGLLSLEQLESVELVAKHMQAVRERHPGLAERKLIHETLRRLINAQTIDLIETTQAQISAHRIETLEDVHAAPRLAGFSEAMHQALKPLRVFLREQLYWNFRVLREMAKAKRIIRDLFDAFMSDPRLLPPQYQRKADEDKARAIADYIAGMTDRYAMKEHRRLFAIGDTGL
ncbi:deoxyguanosinetriphosphate triphosphohydrolase [Niveibacterium umoris]|uniref:Deoxyguanosinetriphosphate triphosphohydrolase-like protein n=1 Tax=Niveibacterium umoris TaxID=1193620 RepID=A0A840BL47_9RHOO|nr:deoxyguanosinetriphosphate triphosphohydrolase [Niveibacterium umoris]MBB4013333.1 dGTPase [Niveibacterium umoris]